MEQMPKDTIMFATDNPHDTAVAYDYEFFKTGYSSPAIYSKIYYKVGNTRDSWVDYDKTIKCKSGSRKEKLAAALADKNFLVDYKELPCCQYYFANPDDGGLSRKYYSPYDGYYSNDMWVLRDDMKLILDARSKDFVDDPNNNVNKDDYISYLWDQDDLIVEFPLSVKNAIISLNTIFYNYEHVTDKKIIYKKIKPLISYRFGFNPNTDKVYDLRFQVYQWKNTVKSNPIVPKQKDDNNNMFRMPVEMPEHAFLFYNGVFYNYTVSPFDRRWITVKDINARNITNSDLNRMVAYRMYDKDTMEELNMYFEYGVRNKYKNSVDFFFPVFNSMILYNGVDHEYAVEDDNAIAYVYSAYALSQDVDYRSDVMAISLYK